MMCQNARYIYTSITYISHERKCLARNQKLQTVEQTEMKLFGEKVKVLNPSIYYKCYFELKSNLFFIVDKSFHLIVAFPMFVDS